MRRKNLLTSGIAVAACVSFTVAVHAEDRGAVAMSVYGEAARAVIFEPQIQPPDPIAAVSMVELDVGALIDATGLVPDDNEGLDYLGRISLQFDDTAALEPPFDVRDVDFATISRLASPDARSPLTTNSIRGTGTGGGALALAQAGGERSVLVNYETAVATFGSEGIGVEIAPRANVLLARDVSGASAGAEVRVGRNLTQRRGSRDERGGWYIFAGADAQALRWRPSPGVNVAQSVQLQDQILVGDAQAGIAWQVGPADVALAVIHREVSYKDFSTDEQFAGVSIVMSR